MLEQLQTQITTSALIHGIEVDLRDAVRNCLPGLSIDELFTEERIVRARKRRKEDGKRDTPTDLDLLNYMDFQDTIEVLQSNRDRLSHEMQSAVSYLADAADVLSPIRNRVAHSRPLEIEDPFDVEKIATKLTSWPMDWPATEEILNLLRSDPSKILKLKVRLATDPTEGPSHNLPAADFSETGFFGRNEEKRKVIQAIKGPWPVISITGDGGMGKTSLALKVAYELLEDSDCEFESIVWVTAKATILTPTEIENISDAIQDSLGLLTAARRELAGDSSIENPLEELLDYMAEFSILLILDNLETVLDTQLTDFLDQLPKGSKVLLTSRIGVGQYEYKVPTGPMSESESIALLMRLAKARGVDVLAKADGAKIKSYVAQMHGNPTHIKWFVSSVQTGMRPEDALADDGLVLDFCMTNVYEFLNSDAKAVLAAMQTENGPLNLGELQAMLNYSAGELTEAVNSLTRSNFISLVSLSHDHYRGSYFELSEQARKYLDKRRPVSNEDRQTFRRKLDGLRSDGKSIQREGKSNPYDWTIIQADVKGEFPAARLLKHAIQNSAQNPAKAVANCSEAQTLSPEYPEVWRVTGQIEWEQGDLFAARTSFDRSVNGPSEPSHISLYFAGRFYIESDEDCHKGVELLNKANSAKPGEPEILAMLSHGYRSIDEPDLALDYALSVVVLPSGFRTDALYFVMETACPLLNNYAQGGYSDQVFGIARRLLDTLKKIPIEDVSSVTDYLHFISFVLRETVVDTTEGNYELRDLLGQVADLIRRAEPSETHRFVGRVKVPPKDGYTFLKSLEPGYRNASKPDYFLHLKGMRDRTQWEYIEPGVYLVFDPAKREDGKLRAEDAVCLAVSDSTQTNHQY